MSEPVLVRSGRRKGLPRLVGDRRPAVECRCEFCGVAFPVKASRVRRGGVRFCCRAHADLGKRARRPVRVCEWCGETFTVLPSYAPERGRFCTWEHFVAGARKDAPATLVEALRRRIWQRADGCWDIACDQDSDGYRVFWWRKYLYKAHRVSYAVFRGPVPEGLVVRHTCHRRWCVNPAHLQVGTPRENIGDAVAAGRQARGERAGGAKTTGAAVRAMRDASDSGAATIRELAAAYGLTYSNVHLIVKRRSWKHLA